jgi:Protein of unknown function (DUF3153)
MMRSPLFSVLKTILRQFIRLRLLWFILVAALFLSGCVHYDTGVNFSDANHGEIVQHIRLKTKDSLSEPIATPWIESLVQRTKALGGKTRHPDAREWVMTIPFYNAKDLEGKFNQLFQSSQTSELPLSRLQIRTKNRVMWQRNEMRYNLDLRSLRAALQGDFSESLDLEFKLRAPGGAQVPTETGELSPKLRKNGWQLVWKLKPGVMNHIEAVFWVPSPIGTGFVVISLLVVGAYITRVLSQSGVEIVTEELKAN